MVFDNALVPASLHRPRPGLGIVDQVGLWMSTNQFDQQAIPQLEPANHAHSDQFMMVLLPPWLCLLLPQQGGCQVPFTRYWEKIAIRFFLCTQQSPVLQFFVLIVISLLFYSVGGQKIYSHNFPSDRPKTPFVLPWSRRRTFTSAKAKSFPVRPPSAS